MALNSSPGKRLFSFAFQQCRSYSAPAEKSIPWAKQKYVPTGGTYPQGFLAGSSHAGVKASNTKYDDIALVVSEEPCSAAAVFTRNIFNAAPVQASRSVLHGHKSHCRGVIVNSGCANAVTGTLGKQHAMEMSVTADTCFDAQLKPPQDGNREKQELPKTLVMSTGVIGQRLPIDRIKTAIPKAHANLGSSHEHWIRAAQAICTTDTFPKLISRTFTLPSHPETEYRIAGMTKGAGMIHPNMGTLLAIVCTDAKIAPDSMKNILRGTNSVSFNSISIDGDTSTNDTVAFFANGAAAPSSVAALQYPDRFEQAAKDLKRGQTEDEKEFWLVLKEFMIDLAQLVVRDGEGATKFVAIRVRSTESRQTARRVASSIATSALVKTALYGKDANWGRILCAIGYAPGIINNPQHGIFNSSHINPSETSVSFIPADGSEELRLLVRGEPQEVDEARAKEILEMEDLEILVKLNDAGEENDMLGKDNADSGSREEDRKGRSKVHEATYWTCDFSHEYVTINGDYRT